MKFLKLFSVGFLVILLGFTFSTCSEDDFSGLATSINGSKGEDTKIYIFTQEETNYIAEEIDSTDAIVLSGNTPDEIIPKVGDIIQMPISEKSPYGFLGKVKSIQVDENIVVITEEVALDEAYPNLSIDTVINVLDDIIGVYDEDGNQVEYFIEYDSTETTRAAGEFDWEDKRLNVPIPTNFLGEGFSATGSIKISFKGSKFDLDNKDEFRYMNLELCPSVTLSASLSTDIKSQERVFTTKPLTIKARVLVGAVVIPITIPICLKAGVKGEFTSTLEVNYTKSCNAYLRYKNDEWSYDCIATNNSEANPWIVSSFDVNGSLYAGIDVKFIAGLYSSSVGVGFELFPNASLSANASLSSINPFNLNPEVAIKVGLESRVFCMGKIFSKKIKLFNIALPEAVFFKRSVSMFPQISNFDVNGASRSAEISYQSDSYYFLQALGVKTGAIVYKEDKQTEFKRLFPEHNYIDNQGNRYYSTNIAGLSSGTTYYAAPIITWLNYMWNGELIDFSTEANYSLAFRCINQSYDVIHFDFSLNDVKENSLDYTVEATDYSGEPMRAHITAQYNASTKTLDGTFEFYFYNDPDQQRKDGFSVSLANDDSGYIDCRKVIDNNGCFAALRIYKSSNKQAAKKSYDYILDEDACNSGLYNEYYQKEK